MVEGAEHLCCRQSRPLVENLIIQRMSLQVLSHHSHLQYLQLQRKVAGVTLSETLIEVLIMEFEQVVAADWKVL